MGWGMPFSPGFTPCNFYHKPFPLNDPHDCCLKCLEETNRQDKCKIFQGLQTSNPKGQGHTPKSPIDGSGTEADLGTIPCRLVPSTSVSVQSAPLAPAPSLHHSVLPIPKKKQRKQHSETDRFLAKKSKKAAPGAGPLSGQLPPSGASS